MTMTLVSTVTVGAGGAASIEFTGIPQTGQDLYVVLSSRSNSASVKGNAGLRFNADASSSYGDLKLYKENTTIGSYTNTASQFFIFVNGDSSTANTFSTTSAYISNYKSSVAKSISIETVTENNAVDTGMEVTAAKWTGTAAITSVTLRDVSGLLMQNSTASLYTISTTGATGATVA